MTTPVQNGELINDIRLLNADVLVSGTVAAFSSGLVAGRNTIIITLDGTAPVPVGELFCVISRAEALDLPSVVLAPGGVDGVLPRSSAAPLRHVHLLVSPALDASVSAVLAAAGILNLLLGAEKDGPGGQAVLAAPTAAEAVDRACLLLSYLPATIGDKPPIYVGLDRPDVNVIAARAARNAIALLFNVFDDVLRVWPSTTDELPLNLCRVNGRVVAVIAPQPLAGPVITASSADCLVEFLGLAQRMTLPVVVLGGLQAGGTYQLRAVASVVREYCTPLLLVQDDATASPLQDLLRSAPAAVEISAEPGLRAQVLRWIT
jgi:hypothetical protein